MLNEDTKIKDSDNEADLKKFYRVNIKDRSKDYDLGRREYFARVQSALAIVKNTKAKCAQIQNHLRLKIISLENEIKKKQSQNVSKTLKINDKKTQTDDLMLQDLEYCKGAIVVGESVYSQIEKNQLDLENILETREKRFYEVALDVFLAPLPSDRAKDEDRDKDKDRDGSDEKQRAPEKDKKIGGRLSFADLKKLRNGQSLEALPESKEKANIQPQNINMGYFMRQKGGLSL